MPLLRPPPNPEAWRRPPASQVDPKLPVQLEFTVTEATPERLRIHGYVLAPDPIDHVVIYHQGKPLGATRYPIQDPAIAAAHPAYKDPHPKFAYRHLLPLPAGQEITVRIVAYTKDKIAIKKTLILKVAPNPNE